MRSHTCSTLHGHSVRAHNSHVFEQADGKVVLANSGTTAATVTMKNIANAGSVLFHDAIGSSTIALSEVTNAGSVTMSGGTATGSKSE